MKALWVARHASLTICTGTVLFFVSLPYYRKPAGYFDAHPMLGYHSTGDVLQFSAGAVTYHTCCGTSWLGSFKREGDLWIWQVPGSKWRIDPGPFALACTEVDVPTSRFVLYRKFWRPPRVGHRIRDSE